MDESVHKPCTSSLRRVSAKAEQAIINGHESIKQFCFVDKKSNICSLCKCVPQNAFVQWTLIKPEASESIIISCDNSINSQVFLEDLELSFGTDYPQ